MREVLEGLQRFLEAGGPVLWVIGLTAVLLGALIIERYWYFRWDFPQHMTKEVERWSERKDRHSWYALRIRDASIADAGARLNHTLPMIKALIAVCPLLGLLGTVTGMMAVFDVIAVLGTGNVRAMASGISRATIPTMAGMMVAIPGLYFRSRLQREMARRVEYLSDRLTLA
ncbi:MotA/TolQ/ExbB proton channel family protein [Thiohalomonas denitrificans]|uniref:MotA/TolQ/ExbB proton channel family protein n=1 Tax=Thiohalomonas denitrificans TaxID=415747 RepID=UPI0026E9309F|nr:MotA/TolQ/ExbB proton channel family protein [Thiohalomonas denitrificans]